MHRSIPRDKLDLTFERSNCTPDCMTTLYRVHLYVSLPFFFMHSMIQRVPSSPTAKESTVPKFLLATWATFL